MPSRAAFELIIELNNKAASGMQNLKRDADGVTRSVGSLGTTALGTRTNLGLLGIAAGGLATGGLFALGSQFGDVIDKTASFDQKLAAIKATSGATDRELDELRKTALDLGMATDVGSVSADDAADAIFELGKAGLSTDTIMDGAAKSVLQLAAAAGPEFGVANAAALAGDALNTFKREALDSKTAVDTLVGAANASSIGLGDLKLGLAAVGPVAATVGLSFNDTATALALFGNNGLKGSDAGTSLKTMLMNLQPQTARQKEAMIDLGLATAAGGNAFFDAQGKIKPLSEIAETLRQKLSGLTDQQRLQALETIFGSDAVRAASILYKEGAIGVGELATQMTKQGDAARVAGEMSNNLAGKWEALVGTVDTLKINIGTALVPALSSAVDWLNNFFAGATGAGSAEANQFWKDMGATFEDFKLGVKGVSDGFEVLKGKINESQTAGRSFWDNVLNVQPGETPFAAAVRMANDNLTTFKARVNESQTEGRAFWTSVMQVNPGETPFNASVRAANDNLTTFKERVNQSQIEGQAFWTSVMQVNSGETPFNAAVRAANDNLNTFKDRVNQSQTEGRAFWDSVMQVNPGETPFEAVIRSINAFLTTLINKAREAIRLLLQLIGIDTGGDGGGSDSGGGQGGSSSGGFASGGSVRPGGPFLVGERGPELFVPRRAGNIVPNSMLRGSLAAAGGPSVVVHLTVQGSLVGMTSDEAMDLLAQRLYDIIEGRI